MTRDQWKERLPFIQAFANGERVQCNFSNGWEDIDAPNFTGTVENYRIVPNPEKQALEVYEAACRKYNVGDNPHPTVRGIKAVLDAIKDGTIVL